MRIFIALDIDDAIRERIALFQDGVRGFAPDAGWVRPESLHVTLKFIGEKPDAAVEQIRDALSSVSLNPFSFTFRGVGFFPTAKSPRVFWLGIEAGPELATLAAKVDTTMESFGIPKEAHAYSPHLTLARGPRASGARA
jgi:2'-5' RNA ligase